MTHNWSDNGDSVGDGLEGEIVADLQCNGNVRDGWGM